MRDGELIGRTHAGGRLLHDLGELAHRSQLDGRRSAAGAAGGDQCGQRQEHKEYERASEHECLQSGVNGSQYSESARAETAQDDRSRPRQMARRPTRRTTMAGVRAAWHTGLWTVSFAPP